MKNSKTNPLISLSCILVIIASMILFVVLFSGCELAYNIQDNYTLSIIEGQKLYNTGFPEMKTFEDVADYVESVLDYDYDMDWSNPIVSPE